MLEIEVDDVGLFAAHLASRHEEAEHPRPCELCAILRVAGGGPHVIAGDFNTIARDDPIGTPPPGVEPRGDARAGAAREVLAPLAAAGYVDCYRAVHPDEPGHTYPAEAPWLRLDYVFASPALAPRLRGCDVVRSGLAIQASDHLPVWADFA